MRGCVHVKRGKHLTDSIAPHLAANQSQNNAASAVWLAPTMRTKSAKHISTLGDLLTTALSLPCLAQAFRVQARWFKPLSHKCGPTLVVCADHTSMMSESARAIVASSSDAESLDGDIPSASRKAMLHLALRRRQIRGRNIASASRQLPLYAGAEAANDHVTTGGDDVRRAPWRTLNPEPSISYEY